MAHPTKGKWQARHDEDRNIFVIEAVYSDGSSTHLAVVNTDLGRADMAEIAANAALLGAAQNLLHSLKWAVEILGGNPLWKYEVAIFQQTIAQAKGDQ